jgi:hypothetical protein
MVHVRLSLSFQPAIIETITNYVRLPAGLRELPEAVDRIMPGPQENLQKAGRIERPGKKD